MPLNSKGSEGAVTYSPSRAEKYVTVILGTMMVMVTLGFVSSTRSLFPDEIARELGVSRSAVVVGESLRYISTSIVNVFFGALIAKFGEKKMITLGFASLIASVLLYATAETLVGIYVGGILLGIGFSQTTTAMVGYIVGKRFTENKGTVMGAMLASNGIGGAVAIQIVGGLIDPAVVGSYRRAYFVIAVVLAVAMLIVLIFYRGTPDKAAPIVAKNAPIDSTPSSEWQGIPFCEAKRQFSFYGALVCIFFSGMILQGTHGIVAMHFKDVGLDYDKIKWLLSAGSFILAGTKLATGICYDRFGLRVTASACTAISVISSLILAFTTGNEWGLILAGIYTVISPFALPLETVMLPIYANELFGKHSYSKILGIFVSVNTAGYAVGAPVMNLCYDVLGSYKYALIVISVIMSAVFVLLQAVISASAKARTSMEGAKG